MHSIHIRMCVHYRTIGGVWLMSLWLMGVWLTLAAGDCVVWHVCCMGHNAGHTCMLHAILMDTHIPVAIS